MRIVTVITTGGTIASTSDPSGAKVATTSGADLLAGVPVPVGITVCIVEVVNLNSYDIGFEQMDCINQAVQTALDQPGACGVVVTHGTDTLEETAMLVDLLHDDDRPVVFTGAQLSYDDPDTDGPVNLKDAIAVACSASARGLGVLVCFAGVLHSARGARKTHNSARSAFFDADHGPLGLVLDDGCVRVHTRVRPAETGLERGTSIARTRIDTVAVYPGADATALRAHVAAGARGLVLQGTGYGNANADVVAEVQACTRAGVHVVLSTRVAAGAVKPVYGGGGGGVDLVAAGAIPSGYLRPSQARILLAALVAANSTREQIESAFAAEQRRYVDPSESTSAASAAMAEVVNLSSTS